MRYGWRSPDIVSTRGPAQKPAGTIRAEAGALGGGCLRARLKRPHASKALHSAPSSSKWLMRVSARFVERATDLLAIGVANLLHRRRISAKPSVTMARGRPHFFMIRLRNLSAATFSRFAVTTASKTSPGGDELSPPFYRSPVPDQCVSRRLCTRGRQKEADHLPAGVGSARPCRSRWHFPMIGISLVVETERRSRLASGAPRRAGFIDGTDSAYPELQRRPRTERRRFVSIDRSGGDRGG